jgi:hypothetical protein
MICCLPIPQFAKQYHSGLDDDKEVKSAKEK